MSEYRQKKYSDDTVFQQINKHFISLKDEDIKRNNESLQRVLKDALIPIMKKDNSLFAEMYKSITYAGSFFKGTKVGHPDEYDLDMVLKLPLNYKYIKVETDHNNSGFVKLKIDPQGKTPKWEEFSHILNSWLDSQNYLDREKFHRWMESTMTKAFANLQTSNNHFLLQSPNGTYYCANFSKSGPAFTIKIKDEYSGVEKFSVDIVPCLVFENTNLNGYVKFNDLIKEPRFIVVPKPIKGGTGNHLSWRLSFYDQERQILADHEFGKLKPIIKMMKKLRDKQQWNAIASYYIETVVYHEIIKRKNDRDFFRTPQTNLLIYFLKKLQNYCEMRNLPYLWKKDNNLLQNLSAQELLNYSCRLKNIINDIEKQIETNKLIIAEYILSKSEMILFHQLRANNFQNVAEPDAGQGSYCIIA